MGNIWKNEVTMMTSNGNLGYFGHLGLKAPMIAFIFLLLTSSTIGCPQGDALTPVIDATASGLGCLHFNVLQYFTADEAVKYCQGRGTGGRLVEVANIVLWLSILNWF